MPKERIYGQRRRGPHQMTEVYDLSVQWGKAEQWHAEESDGGSGHISVSIIEQTGDDVIAFANLSRLACNRLIAAIRRARDQAFGKDE